MKKFFILLAFTLLIILMVIGFMWVGIYLPKDSSLAEEKLFSIEKGQKFFQIAENLEKEGLIKSRFLFNFYVLTSGNVRNLKAGNYFLSPSLSLREIAKKIISSEIAMITITIPEGFTVQQIEERLGFKLPGEGLEGFLFPDTYKFPVGVTGEEVVRIMKENFDKKLTSDLREEIRRQGKTIFEIVTMASLIEKEVRKKEDKEIVSGILWKRLKAGMPLQVDATITYITGKKTVKITLKDLQIDSPYNTYKYLGLPPGPICNPGLESIQAAVYPKSSEYWYYLSTPEGETIFSKTLTEHNYAKSKYLK
jgi:UPF0755 protein